MTPGAATAPGHIGITAPSDHPVFSVVGERLSDHGHAVTFFDPNNPIPREHLEALSLFAIKRTRPASVRALRDAERLGVPTWNSASGVLACVTRFSQLCLLDGVGFATPAVSKTKPPGEYVAKGLYHWDTEPVLNCDGDVYEELLATDPTDYKYYVVHDGTAYRTRVLRATSKLWGEKRVLGRADPVTSHVNRITTLMARLGMCALGVDVIHADDGWYAVDVNPCPSFVETGLEDALVDSLESCLDCA